MRPISVLLATYLLSVLQRSLKFSKLCVGTKKNKKKNTNIPLNMNSWTGHLTSRSDQPYNPYMAHPKLITLLSLTRNTCITPKTRN